MLVCLQFESIGRLPDDVAAAHSDYERVTARRAAALENAWPMVPALEVLTSAPSAAPSQGVFIAGESTDLRSDHALLGERSRPGRVPIPDEDSPSHKGY